MRLRSTRSLRMGALYLAYASTIMAAHAQWNPATAVNNPLCVVTQEQRAPQIAPDGKGGIIVVWEDGRNGATDIFAQRISSDGRPLWSINGVPVCTAVGVQQRPEVIPDGHGGIIVVWEDARNADFDVYAQRLDSLGTSQWVWNGVVVCAALWHQQYPRLVSDGRSGAIITWQDSRTLGYDIYAQRIDGMGNRVWTSSGAIVCAVEHTHVLPVIVSDGRGGAIIAWEDGRNGVSQGDIYAQRISMSGLLQWSPSGVGVCTAFNSQRAPQLVSDQLGGAIIVWQDHRVSPASGDIYAQRIDSSGTPLWTVNGASICTATGPQSAPRITSDELGGAWLTWLDERSSIAPQVFVQAVLPDGGTRLPANGISVCSAVQTPAGPKIASDGRRGAIVVWSDRRLGIDTDIIGQRIDSIGTLLWNGIGALISTAPGNQFDPALSADGASGAFVIWTDRRTEPVGGDLYMSRVSSGGFIPVELAAFSARRDGASVTLTWRTESERDNAGFEVQRSLDLGTWTVRGFVTGAGTTTAAREYSFDDIATTVPMWYRLRQVNVDGTASFSPVVAVAADEVIRPGRLQALYPSPARGSTTLSFSLETREAVRVVVYDALGRPMPHAAVVQVFDAGRHAVAVPLASLSPGMYRLSLEGGTWRESRPLLVTP